jgi:hypothetical protein
MHKYVEDSIRPEEAVRASQRSAWGDARAISSPAEHFILGSSEGRIEVEAPGLDKVRRKVANVERLREISLDGEGVASAHNDDAATWKLCRSMCSLRLAVE